MILKTHRHTQRDCNSQCCDVKPGNKRNAEHLLLFLCSSVIHVNYVRILITFYNDEGGMAPYLMNYSFSIISINVLQLFNYINIV